MQHKQHLPGAARSGARAGGGWGRGCRAGASEHQTLNQIAVRSGLMTYEEFTTPALRRREPPSFVDLALDWLGYLRFKGAI